MFGTFVPFRVAFDQYYCYSIILSGLNGFLTLSGLKGFLSLGAGGLPSTLSGLFISEFKSIDSGGLS